MGSKAGRLVTKGAANSSTALITGLQWAIKGGAEDAVDFELI